MGVIISARCNYGGRILRAVTAPPFPSSRPCAPAVKLLWFPAQRQFSKYEEMVMKTKNKKKKKEKKMISYSQFSKYEEMVVKTKTRRRRGRR